MTKPADVTWKYPNPEAGPGIGDAYIRDGDLIIPQSEDEWIVPNRHGLAALALHGQPFGFTWADVDELAELDMVIQLIPNSTKGARADQRRAVEAVRSLQARIAALLPPREPTP